MKYISTRDDKKEYSAEQVLNFGLAPDGGLFIPNKIPKFSNNQIIDNFNLKKSLKHANKIKARLAIIVGEYEFNNSLVSYKNLENGEQICIDQNELLKKLKDG